MENLNDLAAFAAVAREQSFTRAAAKLGVSPSALSQTIRNLEERLGLRLLTRTTRSVASTQAGERLLRTIAPRFEEIETELAALSELRDKPAGTVRITAGEHPAISILQPALKRFLPDYLDIQVEIIIDYGLTDIVAEGYDAGVRMGEQVAKDMIAVRISPNMRMAVVASPAYFERHPPPKIAQDLTAHTCINVRLPTYGGLFAWGLEKDGREVKVRGEGHCVKKARKRRAEREMKEDPSEPPCRRRLQTAMSCFVRKGAVVNVMVKRRGLTASSRVQGDERK
jgi:DNA-binding transcriptional LysR family regulator